MKYALILCIALLTSGVARADAPQTLVYSGALAAVDDESVPDASYPATFSLWDAAAGGMLLWEESQVIQTKAGAFTAVLGAHGTPLDDSLFREHSELWLSIEVDHDTLEPRLQLNSVPWAIRARSAGALACSGCVGAGAVDNAAVQLRVSTGCSVGSAIRSIHADGTVECETAAKYTAGPGLQLTGTTLSLAPQSGACSDGQLLKYSSTDGWTCQDDIASEPDGPGTNDTYAAGSGLALVGTTFSISPDSGSCSEAQVLKYSAISGWTCRDDVDTDIDTVYSAGSGLALTGTSFKLAPSSGTCDDGQVLKYAAANGGWRCEDDIDTFAPLSAGDGIATSDGMISVDMSVVQKRISTSCPGGTAIQGINADGSVACVGISSGEGGGGGGGTVTQVATGVGLSGGPITGNGTLSLAPSYVDGSAYDERFVRVGCSAPIYLGTTPGSFTGRLSGYARMHRKCQAAYLGSKVCSGADIMRATACLEDNMLDLPDGYRAWFADGTVSAGDVSISECDGFRSDQADKRGRVWAGPQGAAGEGAPAASSCNTSLPIMCCRM